MTGAPSVSKSSQLHDQSVDSSVSGSKPTKDQDKHAPEPDFEPLVPTDQSLVGVASVNILEQIKPDPPSTSPAKSKVGNLSEDVVPAVTESLKPSQEVYKRPEQVVEKISTVVSTGVCLLIEGHTWQKFLAAVKILQYHQSPPGLADESEYLRSIAGSLMLIVSKPHVEEEKKSPPFCLELESELAIMLGDLFRGYPFSQRTLEGYWIIKEAIADRIDKNDQNSHSLSKLGSSDNNSPGTVWGRWIDLDYHDPGPASRSTGSENRSAGTSYASQAERVHPQTSSSVVSTGFQEVLRQANYNIWARCLVVWEAVAEFLVLEGRVSLDILHTAKSAIVVACANKVLDTRNINCPHRIPSKYLYCQTILKRDRPKSGSKPEMRSSYSIFGTAISNKKEKYKYLKQESSRKGPMNEAIGNKYPNSQPKPNPDHNSTSSICKAEFYSPLSKHSPSIEPFSN